MEEYTVVFVGEIYVTVDAETEEEAREEASERVLSLPIGLKLRDSYIM